VIIYPNMRHEILNEDDNEKVYLDILGFLNTASF
jgi:alpha-beta hydrolase superfamily lysophospholipase